MLLKRRERLIEKSIEKNVHAKRLKHLSVFSILMIPISTYRLSSHASPIHYTFSMIGNRLGHRIPFIIRGVITGSMLLFFVLRLYILKSFKDKKARDLLFLATILIILTVLIPASNELPILKQAHLMTAIAFAVCLVVSLYLFTIKCPHTDRKTHVRSMILLYATVFGSLILLLIFGKTGIFEIFFFCALTIFLVLLKYRTTDKNRKIKK